MAHDISSAYVKVFDDQVKQAYQEMGGKLRKTLHTRTGVKGTEHTFNVYGLGFAKDAPVGGADAATMGSKTTTKKCVLSDKQASEYSNIFNNDKVNFDDEQELVKVIAGALGRTEDQTVIDAFKAESGTSGTAMHKIAADFESTGTDTALTIEKIEEAVVLLDDAGIPAEDRYFVAPAKAKRSLLASAKATSSDFVGEVRPLVNGKIDEFLGFKFVWIGDTTDVNDGNKKYGLPTSGTNRLCYAYHEQSAAAAVGTLDKQTEINYVAQKFSYFVAAPLRVGACVREANGVVEVAVKI